LRILREVVGHVFGSLSMNSRETHIPPCGSRRRKYFQLKQQYIAAQKSVHTKRKDQRRLPAKAREYGHRDWRGPDNNDDDDSGCVVD
jgi:hypothetical protein